VEIFDDISEKKNGRRKKQRAVRKDPELKKKQIA